MDKEEQLWCSKDHKHNQQSHEVTRYFYYFIQKNEKLHHKTQGFLSYAKLCTPIHQQILAPWGIDFIVSWSRRIHW